MPLETLSIDHAGGDGQTIDSLSQNLPANICVAGSSNTLCILGEHDLSQSPMPIVQIEGVHLGSTVRKKMLVSAVVLEDLTAH